MTRLTCILLAMGTAVSVRSQQFDYKTPVSWAATPALHTVPEAYGYASAVTILDERSLEYRQEKNDFNVYETCHKIFHIRDDKGIEFFNKIYLPVREHSEITDIRARTISASGKVIDLTPDKIKSTEEDGTEYRQFAMDGVEKGSEVEYYYTEKRPFYIFGSEFYQTGQIPCLEARFLLLTPSNLRFSAKGYNGFRVSTDSLIGDERVITGYQDDIKDLPEEKYSFRDGYMARVDFKLSYNLDKNEGVRLYTWKDLGKRAYAFYTDRNDKDEKSLSSFVSKMPLSGDTTLAGRIAFIENYVKTNIDIDKKLTGNNGDMLPQVVNTRNANDEGVIRLFTGIFERLGIAFDIVLASDRSGVPLDPDLEDWDRAENVLLYFPGTGAFIDPSQQETRYPYVRPALAGSRGLYLKTISLGSYRTAMASWGEVPIAPFDSSSLNMEADLRFNATFDTLLVHGRQVMRGYGAAEYRPIYTFLPKAKQDEANRDIVKAIGNSSDVSNINVSHSALTECLHNTPLVIEADLRCPDLIENAGSRILLKIGEIIGTQVEMYQERPRQLPAEMPFPHEEDRVITLHVPEGYVVKNLKDLSFNVVYPATGEQTMGFNSTYTQNGSVITIAIHENYRKVFYPLSQFEDFKRVINTSADFNKVVLVLEKN